MKRYVCIRQHDITDCGAACLAAIAKQYGLKIPIAKIRQIAGTDKRGTNALGMIKAAEILGFSAKGVRAEKKHLTKSLPLPCVAHVVKDNLQHYVVIHRIKKDIVTVADPAVGIIKYPMEEFFAIWSGVLLLMVPSEQFDQRDETTGFFTRFLALLMPYKGLLAQIFLASVIYTFFGILGAFYLKTLVDDLLVDNLAKTLHVISIGFMFLTVFRIILDAFRNHLLAYLCQKIDITLMLNYYQHVLSLPMSFFDTRRVGEILSRLSDASKIRSAISSAALSVMLDTLMVISAGVILFLQNRSLFTVTFVFVPLYILVLWAFNKPYSKVQRKSMEQAADLESFLVESLNGVASIKAFSGEKQAHQKTETKFVRLIKTVFQESCLRNLQRSLQNTLSFVGELIILWVGGLLIIKGKMSIGQLLTYNALLAYFFQPVANLAGLQPMLQEAFIAADRLGEILDLDSEDLYSEDNIKLPERFNGRIAFRNIHFCYGRRQSVLKGINLTVEPGEKVGLVGESGSGKTTLVKLLLGYYSPTEGEIALDNYNFNDFNLEDVRSRIGYVPQDIFLFSGTIWENLTFGLDEIKTEEIIQLAQKISAFDFINDLPQRYNTLVGERGMALSGGQRQRIAIMRALLKKPDILILDEATSNLDLITEQAIHFAIDDLCKDITTILVAHRLSTIMRCDKIVVLADGKIAEIGSHQQLLDNENVYYNLWQSQVHGKVVTSFQQKTLLYRPNL